MTLLKQTTVPGIFSDFFDDDRLLNNGFLFPQKAMNNLPMVNITENGKSFKIEFAAPGMKKDDFKIDVDNDMLTISSEKEEEKEEKNERFTKREFNYSSFCRSFMLPETVKADEISAKYEHGILRLEIPKKKESKEKQVKKIKVS